MTTILQIVVLIAGLAGIALVLFRGFSDLNRRLDAAMRTADIPLIAFIADVEDTVALVNVGNGAAIEIAWALSPTGASGAISYLTPSQSWHIQLPEQQGGELSVSYKSISGELFSCRLGAAKLVAADGHLALA